MTRSTKAVLLAATVVLAAGSLVVWAEGLRVDSKAPDFTLKDTSGRSFKLSSYKGKPVFINFFATWCGPCRDEFPEIVKLHKEMNAKGVKVISLSVDSGGTINRVKPFADSYKAKHQVLLGSGAMKVAEDYAVEGIPSNYLIGKDGKVKKNWVGYRGPEDAKDWEKHIKAALK